MNARVFLLALALSSSVAVANPSGRKWGLGACGTGCPMGQACVSTVCVPQFRTATSISNTGGTSINGGVAYSTVVSRTIAAFAAWTTGHTTCATSWNSSYVGTFSSPAGLQAVNGSDKYNNVIWLSGNLWTHLDNELALTTTTYYTSNSEIFDGDMELNNNLPWSDNLTANTYDMESVILHEAGHFLGLNHTQSTNAVMYPTVNLAEAKRTLDALDENDVCTVYPGSPGLQGVTCAADSECTGGRVCRSRPGSTSKICTPSCTSATTCPTGYTCQTANTGMACLPQVGAPDQCKFCQTGGECSGGLCLRFTSGPATGVTFCSSTCTEDAQCPTGNTCQLPDGFCVPTADTCTNQCTTSTQCASGYTCTSGTCMPQGDPGDPCTVSLYCKSCSVCTRESSASPTSYCRTCCAAGTAASPLCTSTCTNTTCGTGNTCVGLLNNLGSVCLPGSTAPTTCQTCNNGQCAEGLSCVSGRCRADCNPQSPGTCSACFTLQSGGGACACPDEIASEGESCGVTNNTLSACGAGLVCVGSTTFVCRARCDTAVPSSCRTGQSCQLMNGVAVCVPGTEGSTCANCTNTGQCNSGLTCYLGRCYQPCNVNVAGTCATCVQSAAGGAGICGCADQISPENGPCGTQPDVAACATGTKCINGTCRGQCDPQVPNTCPQFTDCASVNGAYYCTDQTTTGGGGGTGGGGTGTGGGRVGGGGGTTAAGGGTGGGGQNTDLGCGCGPGGSPVGALLFGLVALLRRRRVGL